MTAGFHGKSEKMSLHEQDTAGLMTVFICLFDLFNSMIIGYHDYLSRLSRALLLFSDNLSQNSCHFTTFLFIETTTLITKYLIQRKKCWYDSPYLWYIKKALFKDKCL